MRFMFLLLSTTSLSRKLSVSHSNMFSRLQHSPFICMLGRSTVRLTTDDHSLIRNEPKFFKCGWEMLGAGRRGLSTGLSHVKPCFHYVYICIFRQKTERKLIPHYGPVLVILERADQFRQNNSYSSFIFLS